jgi:hypothetical protein
MWPTSQILSYFITFRLNNKIVIMINNSKYNNMLEILFYRTTTLLIHEMFKYVSLTLII